MEKRKKLAWIRLGIIFLGTLWIILSSLLILPSKELKELKELKEMVLFGFFIVSYFMYLLLVGIVAEMKKDGRRNK